MTVSTKRILYSVIVTTLAAIFGVTTGFFLGCAFTVNQTQNKLVNDAQRFFDTENTIYAESKHLLAQVNASPNEHCSEADIQYIRKMLFATKYLRDAGRMHDGRLECSAMTRREDLPRTQFKPAFTQADGSLMYRNLPLYFNGAWPQFTLQAGDVYILFDPTAFWRLDYINPDYTVSMPESDTGKFHRLRDLPPRAPGAIIDQEAQGRAADILYVTRCNVAGESICSTVYAPIPDALRAARPMITLFTSLGGISCGLLGLFGAVAYRRSQNMERQLRRAIRQDKLQVLYQPVVEMHSRQIVGAEALSRWRNEDGIKVGPEVFVHLAEECGFIRELTRQVLRQTLSDFGEQLRHHTNFRISINVTSADLRDPEFLPMLEQSIKIQKCKAERVIIEITEGSSALSTPAMQTIHELRSHGYSVHLDDFGTGYSSLSYLHELTVDAIKIDQSFTRAIGTEAVTGGILPLILEMAKKLNLHVIVEGVETEEQADYFSTITQPIYAQGFLYGRPMTAAEFHRQLKEQDLKAHPYN